MLTWPNVDTYIWWWVLFVCWVCLMVLWQLGATERTWWVCVSLEPRLPFRILSCSFGEKSEVKPGRISHVIRWHRDINLPSAKATSHGMFCCCVLPRERCESQNEVQGDRVTWRVGSLFTKRSYSSRLDILLVTGLPKYWSLCMGATKKLYISAHSFISIFASSCD